MVRRLRSSLALLSLSFRALARWEFAVRGGRRGGAAEEHGNASSDAEGSGNGSQEQWQCRHDGEDGSGTGSRVLFLSRLRVH